MKTQLGRCHANNKKSIILKAPWKQPDGKQMSKMMDFYEVKTKMPLGNDVIK